MLGVDDVRQKLVEFDTRFGRSGEAHLYFAPGRINLIGEHTDYNGGLVLPVALDRGTYMLIRRSELPPCRLYSSNLDKEARFQPSEIKKEGDWADYVRGVYLIARDVCGNIPPFDGMYFGDLPLEAGLSSSASIEVVTAVALEDLGCELSKADVVKVSRRAENEFVGVNCGVMDQFAVAFARKDNALLLNCDNLDFRQVPYNLKNTAVLVAHTGVKRTLSDSEYNTRRMECDQALSILSKKIGPKRNLSEITAKEFSGARWTLPDNLAMRAEHVIYENIRVDEAARCLDKGDPETLGHLLNRSHASLRDLYEVSSPELDALQEISVGQLGVLGCRMTGAGFGGCVIVLIQVEALERYLRRVPNLYWQSTHYDAEFVIATPGESAHRIEEVR